jgi:hypothetical protein
MTLLVNFLLILMSLLCVSSSGWAGAPASARVGELQAKAKTLDLAHDLQWLRLGHYRPALFGGYESQADGKRFFLAPDGKKNPASELDATIAGFFSTSPVPVGEQHPQCQFPARLIYLKNRLGISAQELPPADCSRFLGFVKTVDAKSVTVVFSSYYLNNPSSAFGHSFIRLNHAADSERSANRELLDYGISYAAVADTSNAILYAVKGVAGGFKGSFSSIPYYYKVREYNDYEARDLWEYDVHFEPEQIELLVAHLWELGSTYFDYYYLTGNCSYHVLSILEVANPALRLTERTPYLVIPVDTIRVINSEPGFVTRIRYRPSVRVQFQKRLEALTPDETKVLQDVVYQHDFTHVSMLNLAGEAKVLDAAADYIDFKYNSALVAGEPDPAQWKQQILLARSKIREASADLDIPLPAKQVPQIGHPSRRVSLGQGWNNALDNYTEVQYRFALHDLTDPSLGFPTYAEIEMGKLTFRYYEERNKLEMENATLVQIFSLTPLTTFDRQLSWHVQFGGQRFYDRICNHCLGTDLEAGAGYSVGGSTLTAYLMGETESLESPNFPAAKMRLGVGPSAGVKLALSDSWLAHFRTTYRYRFFDGPSTNYSGELTVRWGITPRVSVFAHGLLYPSFSGTPIAINREGTLGASFYY